MKKIIIIGYSGHAYVVCDIFDSNKRTVFGYFDKEEKKNNPYGLEYLGSERADEAILILRDAHWFVAIGDNRIRREIAEGLLKLGARKPDTIIHAKSVVSKRSQLGEGSMVAAGAVINPLVDIGRGVICNTGCVIEHECKIDHYVHVAPGAVIAGNVKIGRGSFIGANSTIKQGVNIGKNVVVGAGSVILNDVFDGSVIVGNPGRRITSS